MTYSTAGEDDLIVAYFDRIGVKEGSFLDIGAANGITLSNTHLFAKKGWSGVCVDANAQELFNLVTLYWDNPKIAIVQGAIGNGDRFVEFWNSKQANTSTSCKAMFERGRERVGSCKTYVEGFTLQELLLRFGFSYHLISLDLEGETLSILYQLPMKYLKDTRVICVEVLKEWYFGKDETPEVEAWGQQNGFEVLAKNDENVILCR